MMGKPMKTFKLDYPVIQFLIMSITIAMMYTIESIDRVKLLVVVIVRFCSS